MPSSSRTTIRNPDEDTPCSKRKQLVCYTDASIVAFIYHATGRSPGLASAIISIFIHKLYEELIRLNVHESYDPRNEQLIADVLSRLNFRDEPVAKPRARRANRTLSIPPAQPIHSSNEPATASSVNSNA